MTVYATIQRAALAAARLVWRSMPEDWVTWDEAPAVQCDYCVVLKVVSRVKDDPHPIQVLVPEGDHFRAELYQRGVLNVDVRIESTFGSEPVVGVEDERIHFLEAAEAMRLAWSTEYVQSILGCDVVLTGEFGDLVNTSADRDGVTIPMASYEVQFRAIVGRVVDPTRVGRIDQIAFAGTVNDEETDEVTVGPVP